MSINLALILTVLTFVSGVVVAFNRLYYQKKIEASDGNGNPAMNTLIEYSRSFFPVLLFVLIIRSFIFEPFRIPSGSMMPTLLQGDYIFVKKYSYGLRWPVIEKKFYETGSPERGDVVVFRLPSDPSINYIKRVVGLPGDTVVYQDHQLTVNGQQMPLTKHADKLLNESGVIFTEELDTLDIAEPSARRGDRRIESPVSIVAEDVPLVPQRVEVLLSSSIVVADTAQLVPAVNLFPLGVSSIVEESHQLLSGHKGGP